jgi:CheY-like chemotaxis protein
MMKVLILEHSSLARRFLIEELSPRGFEIIETSTPAEALEKLETIPDISLITTQVVMEETDGFEFLKMIRSPEIKRRLACQHNAEVPAVIVTSNDTYRDRLRGFQVGAADFIEKPWAKGELLTQVNKILGASSELSGLSVLVVDDCGISRVFIRSCLKRLGVTVHEANDGDTALEFLRQGDSPVNLVITDLGMERMNGDELCLCIRNELGMKELPVIFLSGNEDENIIVNLFRMGASDYLQKPFIQEELIARLRAHLEHEKLTIELRETVLKLNELNRQNEELVASSSQASPSPGDQDPAPPVTDGGASEDFVKMRILLVEDERGARRMGSLLLERMGYEVEVAEDGLQAVEMFRSSLVGISYDLILMDMMMPEMSGPEATLQIRELEHARAAESAGLFNATPIVALTANEAEGGNLTACLKAGMNDFLSKPFSPDAIRQILAQWVRGAA